MIAPLIRFENVSASSLTVNLGSEGPSRENGMGYTLWHRMVDETDYPAEPTCILFAPNTRFSVSGLNPATEYLFKVVSFNSTRELGRREVRFQTCSDDNDKATHPKKSLKLERSHSPVTNYSSLSNPSSVEDENNNDNENEKGKSIIAYCKKNEDIISGDLSNEAVGGIGTVQCGTRGDSVSMMDEEPNMGTVPNGDADLENNEDSPEGQTVEETSTENDSNTPVQSGLECVPFAGSSDTAIPITPCKLENFKEGLGRKIRPKNSNKAVDKEEEPQDGGSSKKRCAENGDRDFGYYVKVIRWLECDGHIETSFRQKFLTWYSLRATPQEVRVVKVFVDTLIEDPPSLAGQLVDTFSDVISNKRSSSVVPMGFCLRLWH